MSRPSLPLGALLAALSIAGAADSQEPAARTRTLALEVRAEGSEEAFRAQELVLDGAGRARWRIELPPAQPDEPAGRRIVYLGGERVLELVAGEPASRELAGDAAQTERVAFALWSALLIPRETLQWRAIEGGREADVPLGRLRLRGGVGEPPLEISLVAEESTLGVLREIAWSAARPASLVLDVASRKPVEVRITSIDEDRRYVAAFFLPHDRRETAAAPLVIDARPTFAPLASCVERRVALPPGTSWEGALAREVELRTALAHEIGSLQLEAGRLFELSDEARPTAVLLRLATPVESPPPGFTRREAALGLTLLLPEPSQLDARRLAGLRRAREGRDEIAPPYLRLPPARAGEGEKGIGGQIVVVLAPP